MKHTLLILASAIALGGCAAAGSVMEGAGNWLQSSDNSIAKGVGGFYKDVGGALQGKDADKKKAGEAVKKE